MFILLIHCLLLLSLESLSLAEKPEEDRERLLRLLYIINGYAAGDMYDSNNELTGNFRQLVIPIENPVFYPSITFLYEEGFYNELMFRQVVVLRDGHDGHIYAIPYNFTGMDRDRFGEFNVTLLQELKREDYYTVPECKWIFTELTKTVFLSSWPFCQSIVNNYIPIYLSAWTCGITGLFVKDDPGYRDVVKPILYSITQRYPLLPYMFEGVQNVHDPCA
ncbi:hypothetical protein Bpfe_004902 [Biomphalaria pfeifferi]|uniref:Uncharacterized protein n=1 Tax=Biomphalaria pfeifferi TaxID=112525 RepID=A0AAD8C4P9_BIOPF|nr:hypothetical protein Bpfe_004902 [Biomphalaria pfeifferi]